MLWARRDYRTEPITIITMNKYICTLAIMAVSSLSPSCCNIIHGSKQKVVISSNPAGAKVTINGEQRGVTPTVVTLDRNDEYSVLLTKKGYLPYAQRLEHSISGWVWGNLAFGGVIGFAVDASMGSLYDITPESIHAQMTKTRK